MHRLIRMLSAWRNHMQARHALTKIGPRALREAGIDPGVAEYEIAQPFWRPLLPLRDPPPKAAAPAANDCTPLVAARPARATASSVM